jgi:addiction module HigA family antidote
MARPPIHPGEILADELQELEISAAELARTLHVPTNRITQILNGKRAITADTALRLGQWLGTGPELWLNLQKRYELRLAEEEKGDEIRRTVQQRNPTQAIAS